VCCAELSHPHRSHSPMSLPSALIASTCPSASHPPTLIPLIPLIVQTCPSPPLSHLPAPITPTRPLRRSSSPAVVPHPCHHLIRGATTAGTRIELNRLSQPSCCWPRPATLHTSPCELTTDDVIVETHYYGINRLEINGLADTTDRITFPTSAVWKNKSCVQPRPLAVNMTMPVSAAEHRAVASLLLSTGACYLLPAGCSTSNLPHAAVD